MPLKSFSNSKIFELLKLLSPKECSKLEKWLQSKWPTQRTTLYKLYQLIRPYYPKFDAEELSRESIYKALYPNKGIDYNRLAALLSALYFEIEEFLIHERLTREKSIREYLLIQELLERGKHDWAYSKVQKRLLSLQQKKEKNAADLLQLHLFYEQQHRQPLLNKNVDFDQTNLFQSDKYLNQFYALVKHRYLLELSEREIILGEEHHVEEQLQMLNHVPGLDNSPTINLYQAYISQKDQKPIDAFKYLKSVFIEQYEQISPLDQSILLIFLINQGARAQMKGNTQMLQQLFDLYKIGIERNLLLYHDQLTANTFANIVTLGNSLFDFEFVKNFIDQNTHRLPIKIRNDAEIWAKTHLAFNSKNEKLWQIAEKLHEIKSIKSSFAIRTKVLSIQMWMEDFLRGKEKDIFFMLDLCEAFNRQLKRSKIYSPNRLLAFRNLIQYIRQLIRLKDRNQLSLNKLETIQQTIKSEKVIHAKDWLLQQLEGLKDNGPKAANA